MDPDQNRSGWRRNRTSQHKKTITPVQNMDWAYQWDTHIRGAAIIQEPQAKIRQLTQHWLPMRKV